VGDDPARRRLVVVRRDDEEAVDSELVGRLRQVDGVLGRVRAGARDDGRAVADGVDRRLPELEALAVGERRRLAGRPRDGEAVRAVLDEIRAERPEALEVELARRVERRDDGGQDLAEHERDLTAAARRSR
jgi:hypothetical protein